MIGTHGSENVATPEFLAGLSFGLFIAPILMDRTDEVISENKASKLTPGCQNAKEFRDKYVFIENPQIDPIIPPGKSRRYYKKSEVLALQIKNQYRFDYQSFMDGRRNKNRSK